MNSTLYNMRFIVDEENKVILGWSAKCGCSHVKKMFRFLQNGKIHNPIHTDLDMNSLPDEIENYTTIIVGRNPYKRLVSGFLDKYKPGGEYRHLWKKPALTFSSFVSEVVCSNWRVIDQHHFGKQTGEFFNKNIIKSKCIKYFDIEDLDYTYFETLYNKKIPGEIMNFRGGHQRDTTLKSLNEYVYDKYQIEYLHLKVDYRYFYNQELKSKIFKFYGDDFSFFKDEFGIEYKI